MRRAVVVGLAAAVALMVGCGEDESGGNQPITVWTNESQPDRLEATEAILADFTRETGIRTELVPVPEGQLATLTINAAAAGEMPEVVMANSMADSQGYAAQGIYNARAAQEIVERLGPETFSPEALELVERNGVATGVPSDAWGMLLIYRRDLFERAGLDTPDTLDAIRAAAERLDGEDVAGITLATAAGDEFTAQTVEHIALAYGCDLVDENGNVTFGSPPCVEALDYYGELARDYSVAGAQDVDTTRGTYFAGDAAMMFWSPFLLDGMAGLRADTLPSCPQCRDDPAFLAKNSGLIGALAGPGGGEPTQFGNVSTFNIGANTNTRAAQALIEFMMTDGYVRWLALSPQGKYPVRGGPRPGSTQFIDAWSELESGVDKKAPLSDFYSRESLDALREGVQSLDRWAFAQGYGALIGALSGEQPIADAGAEVIAGGDAAEVAQDTAAVVEEIKGSLE